MGWPASLLTVLDYFISDVPFALDVKIGSFWVHFDFYHAILDIGYPSQIPAIYYPQFLPPMV